MCVVCGRHDRCRCGRRSDDGQAGKLKSNAWKMINGRDSLKILSSLFQFLALTLPLPPTHTRTRNIFICVSLQCNHVVVVADRPLMKYKWSVFGLLIWRKVQFENGLNAGRYQSLLTLSCSWKIAIPNGHSHSVAATLYGRASKQTQDAKRNRGNDILTKCSVCLTYWILMESAAVKHEQRAAAHTQRLNQF